MKEMTLQDHLVELRKTLIRIVWIVVLAFFLSYNFGEIISEFLLVPLRAGLKNGELGQIVYLGILDKMLSQIQVSLWSSVILSSPIWFYEIWKFIKPALYPEELNSIRPFIFLGFFLFISGVLFGYYLVFPLAIGTLLTFGVTDVVAQIDLKDYLVLTSKLLVMFGLIFQLPNVMLVVAKMGIFNVAQFRDWRSYVVVIFAVVAAILTPTTDMITMLGVWLPLVVLYEIGIFAVSIFIKKKE